MKIFLFVVLFIPLIVSSQILTKDDSLAKVIPDSTSSNPQKFAKYLRNKFHTDDKVVRALYVWLGSNIKYDLDRLDSIYKPLKNEETVLNSLKSKKGICQNYADIFTNICKIDGIVAFTISGYAKVFDKIETRYGHAWNIAKIDSSWYLFDPTWAAGYVRYERFHKKFTFDFYKSEPDSFIKKHMPFDPIWQLLYYPVRHEDFFAGKTKGTVYFNFNDSLEKYCNQDIVNKTQSSLSRAKANGLFISELSTLSEKFKNYCEYFIKHNNIQSYSNAVNELNKAIEYLQKYNSGKRNAKVDGKILNAYFISVRFCLNKCKEYINKTTTNPITKSQIETVKNEIIRIEKQINSQNKSNQVLKNNKN